MYLTQTHVNTVGITFAAGSAAASAGAAGTADAGDTELRANVTPRQRN
eukprot:SAG11_NODE_11633_length_747_cov_1.356481_1_plen_47_part_01